MAVNFGNAVTDPAEQARIMGLATDFVNRNEAGSGLGRNSYLPGFSREKAIEDAAYSYFPRGGGGGGAGGGMMGALPTGSPYGDFAPPSVGATDPREGEQALQRAAAARGTLLSGGLLKSLERYRQGLKAQDAQAAFNRALQTYTTNRDTHRMNYDESRDAMMAPMLPSRPQTATGNQSATFATSDPSGYAPQTFAPSPETTYSPVVGDDYATQAKSAQAQNAAQSAMLQRPLATGLPMGELPTFARRPVYR